TAGSPIRGRETPARPSPPAGSRVPLRGAPPPGRWNRSPSRDARRPRQLRRWPARAPCHTAGPSGRHRWPAGAHSAVCVSSARSSWQHAHGRSRTQKSAPGGQARGRGRLIPAGLAWTNRVGFCMVRVYDYSCRLRRWREHGENNVAWILVVIALLVLGVLVVHVKAARFAAAVAAGAIVIAGLVIWGVSAWRERIALGHLSAEDVELRVTTRDTGGRYAGRPVVNLQ